MRELPVVAAIPNYNMGRHLRTLLPQLLEQHYDHIFVLDDGSTDDSVDVVSEFADEVKLVQSIANKGAGANRNQIIDHVGDDEIIHFIDADMELDSAEIPAVARELMARYAEQRIGLIGGLVVQRDGSQLPHNYGTVFSLWGTLTSSLPLIIDRLRTRPRLAGALQQLSCPIMRNWPNILEPPTPTSTYWVSEGNMLVYSSIFKAIGGFDPVMREQEIQDLAIRLEKLGIKRHFDPSIRVIHHALDVRGRNRSRRKHQAMLYLIRKHGLIRWLKER